MNIINTLALKSNKINFDGGNLSSDAGLLLIKEFVSKLGIEKLFSNAFKTNDSASFRYHTDQENLLQMIYMIIEVTSKMMLPMNLQMIRYSSLYLKKMLLHHSLRYQDSLTVWMKIF